MALALAGEAERQPRIRRRHQLRPRSSRTTVDWPLPATGSCEALARAARANGVLCDEPYIGDIFLLYSRTRARFIHTGIVVGVEAEERVHERDVQVCVTVEGNTNNDGSSNGHTTLRKVWTFREADGHRFIRWAEMVWGVVAA